MAAGSKSVLGDSWVVEEEANDDVGWEASSAASDSEEEPTTRRSNLRRPTRGQRTVESSAARKQTKAAQPEPEFVMPSMTTSMPGADTIKKRKPPASAGSVPSNHAEHGILLKN